MSADRRSAGSDRLEGLPDRFWETYDLEGVVGAAPGNLIDPADRVLYFSVDEVRGTQFASLLEFEGHLVDGDYLGCSRQHSTLHDV